MLTAHILNLHGQQCAENLSQRQHDARFIGMDMELDDLLILCKNHAVAHFRKGFLQAFDPLVRAHFRILFHNTFRTVAENNIGFHIGKISALHSLGLGCSRIGNGRIIQGRPHSVQNRHKAASAGIHHIGALQHRKHFRRFFQSFRRHIQHIGHQPCRVVFIFAGFLQRLFGRNPHNRQNGSLCRVHHRSVSALHAAFEGIGQADRICFVAFIQRFCHALKKE